MIVTIPAFDTSTAPEWVTGHRELLAGLIAALVKDHLSEIARLTKVAA